MTGRRPPLSAGFVLIVLAGFLGTAMFAAGLLVALEVMAPPIPVIAERWAQITLMALGLVLMFWEVRALIHLARSRHAAPRA